ncbi:MAG: septal ring lytic transglycosylase RlpA family protein [Cyanobacteria bacterium P01_F01_bin.116]
MPGAIWFMNKCFVGRVVASVLLVTSVPLAKGVNAQTSAQVLDTSYSETVEVSVTNQSLESSPSDTLQTLLRSTTSVRVNAHERNNRQAATVYIQNIPVLTYIDSTETTDVVSGWVQSQDATGVIADANAMAAKFVAMEEQASSFTARWNDGNFEVMAGDSPLVTLGDTIQLPDSTEDAAEDVLQVTNRLRRLLGDGTAEPVTDVVGRPAPPPAQRVAAVRSSYNGMASWYGPGFHGRTSASGESFNQYAMTAAHRTLPFGTQVRVTNLNNGRQVVVRINDRGPYSHGRIIDLSAAAAGAIGLRSAGVGPVQVEVLR